MTFSIITNLIKITVFVNLFLLADKLKTFPLKLHPFYLPFKKPILLIDESERETLIRGRKYMDRCLNFSGDKFYNYSEQIRVSVIIPLYNCEKTIEYSIHSIQFQNMTDIEIILINDFSKDNTSKIIENIQKYDKRIKIINNQKNMGTLYSRSIGALMTKGEYIFGLDNDDMYFDFDVFDFVYKKGKNENLDIINFLTVNIRNYTTNIENMKNIYTYLYPEDFFIEQPELSTWMIKFRGNFLVHNNMIWDKCINSSIYKKAVNLLGIERYSKYLLWAEDTCINFIIFSLAKTFKYIYKYGIAHFKGKTTASITQSNDIKIYGDIFFLEIMYDFSRENIEDKNLIIGQAMYIYNRYNLTKFNNDTNSIYLKAVLNKINQYKYLSKLNKRKLNKLLVYI